MTLSLRAVALHQRAHDSANQDAINRLGRGAEQVAVDLQEICGTHRVKKTDTRGFNVGVVSIQSS